MRNPAEEMGTTNSFCAKNNGTLRFCIDHGKLNVVTKRGSYPIPRLDEVVGSLDEAAIFSTLAASSRYWQANIDKAKKEKTAFASHHRL